MSSSMVMSIYEQTQSQVGTASILQVSRQYVHKVLKQEGLLTPTGRQRKTNEERELEQKHYCQNASCSNTITKNKLKGVDMILFQDMWFCSQECIINRFGE